MRSTAPQKCREDGGYVDGRSSRGGTRRVDEKSGWGCRCEAMKGETSSYQIYGMGREIGLRLY